MCGGESREPFLLSECILLVQAARRFPLPVLAGVGIRRVAAGLAPNTQPQVPLPPVARSSRVDRRTH